MSTRMVIVSMEDAYDRTSAILDDIRVNRDLFRHWVFQLKASAKEQERIKDLERRMNAFEKQWGLDP